MVERYGLDNAKRNGSGWHNVTPPRYDCRGGKNAPARAIMAVFRLTSPTAFEHEPVIDFFRRALNANKLPIEPTIFELAQRCGEETLGIFVATEIGAPQGLCIVMLPTSNFMLAPQVLAAFNTGPHRLVVETIAEAKRWLEGYGFRRLLGCNRSGAPDKVWLRAFKSAGNAEAIGTAYEFRWG